MAVPGKTNSMILPRLTLPLHKPPDRVRHLRETARPPVQLVLLDFNVVLLHLLKVGQQVQTLGTRHHRATAPQAAFQWSPHWVMYHNAVATPCDPVVCRHQPGQRYDRLHWLLAEQRLMPWVLVEHCRPTSQLYFRGNQVGFLLRPRLSKSMGGTSIKKCILTRSAKVPFPNGLHPHCLQRPDGLQEACGLSHQLSCCLS